MSDSPPQLLISPFYHEISEHLPATGWFDKDTLTKHFQPSSPSSTVRHIFFSPAKIANIIEYHEILRDFTGISLDFVRKLYIFRDDKIS